MKPLVVICIHCKKPTSVFNAVPKSDLRKLVEKWEQEVEEDTISDIYGPQYRAGVIDCITEAKQLLGGE